MSDPLKIPSTAPESYTPKDVPEIMKLAEQAHDQTVENDGAQASSSSGGGGMIPNIHRFITSNHGENYWLNGCGRYVMGALGEKDYDYEFFAGMTGDVFAQVFSYDHFRQDCLTDYRLSSGDYSFVLDVFKRCGYAATFVPGTDLRANPKMYLQTLMGYIDRGVPVISNLVINGHNAWIVLVGYEEHGKTLLFMTDNMAEPERVPSADIFTDTSAVVQRDDYIGRLVAAVNTDAAWSRGWFFVGEKAEQKDLKQLYRDAIAALPGLLTIKTEAYCSGGEAFRAWAAEIESGKFDSMEPENFEPWLMYSNYVCMLATNGSCCHGFLKRARKLNPDMEYLKEVSRLYKKTRNMWNKQKGRSLEALGGGFNITLETLQDKEKRAKIAAKIRECGDVIDEVVRVLENGLQSQSKHES